MHKTLNNKHENLVIITAPSGAGKTTLIKNILDHASNQDHKVYLSISHTTRVLCVILINRPYDPDY